MKKYSAMIMVLILVLVSFSAFSYTDLNSETTLPIRLTLSESDITYQPFGRKYDDMPGYRMYRKETGGSAEEANWPEQEAFAYLQQQLSSRMEKPDIYHSRGEDNGLLSFVKKGFYIPLKGEAFSDFEKAVYPPIAAYIAREDELAMVPVQSYFPYMYMLNPKIMQELGLREEELPKTLMELFDFAAHWPETYGKGFPMYRPLYCFVGSPDVEERNFAASLVMKAYLYSAIKSGGELRYNTPLFRKLLAAIEPFTQPVQEAQEDQISDMPQWGECLFYVTWGSSPFKYRQMKLLPPFPLDEQSPSVQPLMLTVAHLNPFGTNKEAASELMSYLALYPLPELARVIGFETSPLENPEFEALNAELSARVRQSQRVIGSLEGKERLSGQEERELEEARGTVAWYEQWRESARYQIDQEQIQLYNTRLAPWLYVCGSSPYEAVGFAKQADSLLVQYLDGVLPMEQLIDALDNVVRLMALENQ